MKPAKYASLTQFWAEKKQEFLDTCSLCGACMEVCPILKYTDYANDEPVRAMERFNAFLHTGADARAAYSLMKACMGCGLCAEACPDTKLHQIAKDFVLTDLDQAGLPLPKQAADLPENPDCVFKFFAALQSKPQDRYRRWLMSLPESPAHVDTIFFPSCSSPGLVKRLFDVMDIIEMTGIDYLALSPFDLDLCCGCMHMRSGYLSKAEERARGLVKTLSRFSPRKVVVACPHTYWWLRDFVPLIEPYDFAVQHQVQFIADHLDELEFRGMDNTVVAYHDSCGFGRWAAREYEAPRRILRRMPGARYVELPRNRENAACCGGGAPLAVHLEYVNARLKEAQGQGAKVLTSVCAGCVMAFQKCSSQYNLEAVNIVSFVAEGLGIHNKDPLPVFARMGNADEIIKLARENFERSHYTEEKVRALIHKYLFASRSLGTNLE